jgi:DnaK suppressor protein
MPILYEGLKQALLAEQVALNKELAELQATIKEEGVGYSTHPADEGSNAFDQARDLAVQVSAEQTLKLVDDALVRFDNGTYGLCLNCGKEIDAARLEAIPYAPLCLNCQAKTERH